MKILLVGKPWRGLWLDYVHHALVEQGHEVRLFHTTGNGALDRVSRRAGRYGLNRWWKRRWQGAILRQLREFSPDAVLVVSALIEVSS